MPKKLALVAALLVFAGMVTISAWPRERGVTRFFPTTFTAGDVTHRRVAEGDGTNCMAAAEYGKKPSATAERVHVVLRDADCRQSMQAVFTRGGDDLLVTFSALRFADERTAARIAAALVPLAPELPKTRLVPSRMTSEGTHGPYTALTSTEGAVAVPPRALGTWVLLVTAGFGGAGEHPAGEQQRRAAAENIVGRFALAFKSA